MRARPEAPRPAARFGIALVLALAAAPASLAQGARYEPPPVIDMVQFCAGVTQESASRYPERALRRGVNGLVMLDCAIGADGALTSCSAIIESPGALGFADAATGIGCFTRVARDAATGLFQTNDQRGVEIYTDGTGAQRARVTVTFRAR
jgi:TonB family protein